MCSLVIRCSHQIRHASVSTFSRSSKFFHTFSNSSLNDSFNETIFRQLKIISVRYNSSQVNESTTNTSENTENVRTSNKKIKKPTSSAMKYYLEKKREYDAFISKERSEFELGKKHLANMMGMDYDVMTQEDVDKAIAYLFPSGLYHPDARPKMKPPEEVL